MKPDLVGYFALPGGNLTSLVPGDYLKNPWSILFLPSEEFGLPGQEKINQNLSAGLTEENDARQKDNLIIELSHSKCVISSRSVSSTCRQI